MARKDSKSCTVGVQKYTCIVDYASGLSCMLSELSCFGKKCLYSCFRVRKCVTTRVPVVLVLSETEVVDHLSHSSLHPDLSQLIVFKLI